jgi:hypothetical protein
VVALGVFRFALPSILKSQVESQLSRELGLPVSIGHVKLSVTGGSIAFSDIRVHAHQDIGGRDALTIGRLAANIEWLPLLSRQLVVQALELHDVDFLALRQEGGARNIGPWLEQLQAKALGDENKKPTPANNDASASTTSNGAAKDTPPPSAPKDQREWSLRIKNAEIRNVAFTVRSEGEPSRQNGEARVALDELRLRNVDWPATDDTNGSLAVSGFTFDGIGGRWEGTRILSLDEMNVSGRVGKDSIVIEQAQIQRPLYRHSWDHLTRDQVKRTEDLFALVFSASDSDFIEDDEDEEEREEEGEGIQSGEAQSQPVSAKSKDADKPDRKPRDDDRNRRKLDIRRLTMAEAQWIHQTRIDGIWTDVVTSFDLDMERDGTLTRTHLVGGSNYDDSHFEVTYDLDENEHRALHIAARRMPFHQTFWGEPVKDERIPRVEHTLYDLDVKVTHRDGLLSGEGVASFSEVRITPDGRPFWERLSLKGGGWATILSDLVDPETGTIDPVPFTVERPLDEFSFFVLYSELQVAFDQARLRALDATSGHSE